MDMSSAEHPVGEILPPEAPQPHRLRYIWSPGQQASFLEAIGAGRSVEQACALVGLPVTSAYAFRRTPAGAAFDSGWRAANLLAMEALRDILIERALHGTEETVTYSADGTTVTRRRFDNRLALAILRRAEGLLDRSLAGGARHPRNAA